MLVPSSPFTFLIGSPTEPGAHSPLVASTGGTMCIAVHGFYVGAGDMNIGPQDWVASHCLSPSLILRQGFV